LKQYVRIVNWDRFQHYKHRDPPWIKLHNTLLEDPGVAALPDATKAHLFGLWLLASRSENKIPADPAFIGKRINATTKVDLRALMLLGFIELHPDCLQDASNPLALCTTPSSDVYTETETETEQRRDRAEKPFKSKSGEQTPDERHAVIEAYNATFGTDLKCGPGNLSIADRALKAGYSMDQIRQVFEAVKSKATDSAAWCHDNNRELVYLLRPGPYRHHRTKELTYGPLDTIPNELATGRRTG
jgi:hypothetical protein